MKVHRHRVSIIEAFRCPSRVLVRKGENMEDVEISSLLVCIVVTRDIWPSTRSDILRQKEQKKEKKKKKGQAKEIPSPSSLSWLLLFFSRRALI
jgi:hypothetical protein